VGLAKNRETLSYKNMYKPYKDLDRDDIAFFNKLKKKWLMYVNNIKSSIFGPLLLVSRQKLSVKSTNNEAIDNFCKILYFLFYMTNLFYTLNLYK
jgi:hypothetical protein